MEMAYVGPRMRGSQSTFQQWAITPLSSNQYWQPNDVIKLMGNISSGLIDFYRSHIEFEIQVTTQMMPVGLIQIDNSAQSIIGQTVLQSNQVEIQRIQQYDTLAACLTDIGFSQIICQGRNGQGIGYTNIPTCSPAVLANTRTGISTIDVPWINSTQKDPSYMVQYNNIGTYSPVIAQQYSGTGYQGNVSWYGVGSDEVYGNTTSSGLSGGSFQTFNNWLSYPWKGPQSITYTSATGRAMCVRSEYNLGPTMTGYPDSPRSIPLIAPFVKNQTWTYGTMLQSGFNPSNPYQTYYGSSPPGNINQLYPITPSVCGVSGYTKPFAPQFCRGGNEPFLSPTIPQLQMEEGLILPQPIPMSRKTFRIPLISAILGILIPPDQFKLIPAASLKNIILQISLNPYAFFTSGYSDIHQFDTVGMQPSNMQKRNWKILTFQWVWHLYTFNSPQIIASIQQQISRGILISSNYWQLQAQYQLPNGSYVRNTFQIPANVQSLGEVWCVFLSNQYQTKTFCRKQFRLSNNMYAMQLKANGMYYPLQPIQGNGGNPQTTSTTGDNWNFYEPILLSNNYLFSANVPMPRINQKNFAINGRIYDTNNQGTMLSSAYWNVNIQNSVQGIASLNAMGGFGQKIVNADTAMGQAWFHQNRYIGKALYCYSFEPYGHSKTQIHGLDTRGYRQFDVTFNNSPTTIFPSDQTLLIFSRANVLVRYTINGIQVLGA